MNDTTRQLIEDACRGPGEYVKRFATAKAHKGALTTVQQALVKRFDGIELGYVSKALVYDDAFRGLTKSQASMFARLIKGGAITAVRTEMGYRLSASGTDLSDK